MYPAKFALLVAALLLALPAAAEWTVKKEATAAPTEVSEVIRPLLSDEALKISRADKPELSLWLLNEWPLSAKPASPDTALEEVAEGALLGVVQVHHPRRDYRDDEMPAGVYTVRMGIRPSDGDHLGTSDYVFFGVLIPATKDKTIEGYKGHEALSEASAEETAVFHPSILSLRPDSQPAAEPLSLHDLAEEHKVVRIVTPARLGDAVESLGFELVLEGHARH